MVRVSVFNLCPVTTCRVMLSMSGHVPYSFLSMVRYSMFPLVLSTFSLLGGFTKMSSVIGPIPRCSPCRHIYFPMSMFFLPSNYSGPITVVFTTEGYNSGFVVGFNSVSLSILSWGKVVTYSLGSISEYSLCI
jgi:hypothetical protein